MRKIIVLAFMTLDGVMQAPGGPQEDTDGGFEHGGWLVPHFDERLGAIMHEQLTMPRDLLLGRRTYEIFATYWPAHEDEWPGINSATKYVVSRTCADPVWEHTVFLRGDVVSELRRLKQQDGLDLQVHGSGQLVQTLLTHGLVDKLWLKIFPIVLGKGKRLFGAGTVPAAFKLTQSEATPSGVIVVSYERSGDVKAGSIEP